LLVSGAWTRAVCCVPPSPPPPPSTLGAQVTGLHSHAAQRLVGLAASLAKRLGRVSELVVQAEAAGQHAGAKAAEAQVGGWASRVGSGVDPLTWCVCMLTGGGLPCAPGDLIARTLQLCQAGPALVMAWQPCYPLSVLAEAQVGGLGRLSAPADLIAAVSGRPCTSSWYGSPVFPSLCWQRRRWVGGVGQQRGWSLPDMLHHKPNNCQ
jgi:hypothetical protein